MTRSSLLRTLAQPTVILSHDAWLDGSGWREVIARLQTRGIAVLSVQTPLLSLTSAVGAVRRVIDRQQSRVVLVGHGYGGAVITQAGSGPQVAALVYVAGFAPDAGESLTDFHRKDTRPEYFEHLKVDEEGLAYFPEAAFIEHFAHDLPEAEGRVLAAAQTLLQASIFEEKTEIASWRGKPVWYLLTTRDRMVRPELQRAFARRTRATVTSAHTGHMPLLSDPAATTSIIVSAVEAVTEHSKQF